MSAEPPEAPAPRRNGGSSAFRTLLMLALPTLILLPLILLSTYWPLPTRVQLDLVTRRLAFTVAGHEPVELLNASVGFTSLVIERCNFVSLSARLLRVLDQRSDQASSGPVRFVCGDPASKLTLRSSKDGLQLVGTLDRLRLAPGTEVSLEVGDKQPLDVTFEVSAKRSLSIPMEGEFELVAEFVSRAPPAAEASPDLVVYRGTVSEADSTVKIDSQERGLILVITPVPGREVQQFFREPTSIPLSAIEFVDQTLEGKIISPILGASTLTYPDYTGVPPISIPPRQFLGVGGVRDFRIQGLALESQSAGLRVQLGGVVETFATSGNGNRVDRRLTLFQVLRYGWRWNILAVVAAWLLSTTWMIYERWRKLSE